jgi:hypothetical protein
VVALGGFKVPDFLQFCQRFKKQSFSKSRLASKKPPSHFQKAGKVLATSPI